MTLKIWAVPALLIAIFALGYTRADNADTFLRVDVNVTALCGQPPSGSGTWYYLESIQECIYISTQTGTWNNAELACRQQRSHLVVLNNNNQKQIADQLSIDSTSGGRDFFIGLKMTSLNYGEYTWLDGSPIIGNGFVNWAPNQPLSETEHGVNFCVVMSGVDGKWSDRSCESSARYVCQKRPNGDHHRPPHERPTRPPGAGGEDWRHGGCADGWVSFGPHCYYLSPDRQSSTWQQALQSCIGEHDMKNASLVSVTDGEENDFLITLLKNRKYNVWIGLHEVAQDVFEWSDHHHYRYNNWHYKYPRQTFWGLECINMLAEINKVGRWTDLDCNTRSPYVCKAPKDFSKAPHQSPVSNCSTGYEQFGDACFQVIHLEREGEHSWGHAEQKCKPTPQENWAGGGGLATILDIYENAFVSILLNRNARGRPGFSAKAWLGMREEYGHYMWHNKCPTHFANLGSLIGDENSTLCVDMGGDGRWHAHNCTERDVRFAVCERRLVPCSKVDSTKPELVVCPKEFPHACADHCYNVQTVQHHNNQTANELEVTFDEARASCQKMGGDLVSIRSEAEQKCVAPYAKYSDVGLWMGLRNVYEGEDPMGQSWVWLDGENNTQPAVYANWFLGEPNYNYMERCVEMYPDNGYWNNLRCDATMKKGYICQADRNREVVATAGTVPPTYASPSDGLGGGAIAGIVIGVLLGVALVGGLGFAIMTGRLSRGSFPSRSSGVSNALATHA